MESYVSYVWHWFTSKFDMCSCFFISRERVTYARHPQILDMERGAQPLEHLLAPEVTMTAVGSNWL